MITDVHRSYLTGHAVSDETIDRLNIRSEDTEIVFPWTDGDLLTEQRRPWPGDSGQYYWEKDKDLHFWDLRDAGPGSPVLVVEGTKQSLATVSYAPDGYSVLGMAGCEGWSKCDLSRFENRAVYFGLDADAGSNLSVYEAGELFRRETEFYGAEVKFLWLPARGSQGMDDVLAKHAEDKRSRFISYLVGKAEAKPAERKPTTRKGAKLETILPDTGDRVGVAINIDRKDVIDKITGALREKLDGTELFNYGDVLTRVKGHETSPMDKDSFHATIADTVACYHYTEATDKKAAAFVPGWPDSQTVGAVMSKADEFSPLKRVVRVPFMRADGSVCSTPGYDLDTATVLVLGELDVGEVPSDPSREETRSAAKFLMQEWLGDFPFPTEADRANALALVLTPFIRGLVPLAPLAVVNGLEMGVGKNLLVDCVHILATGTAAEPLPWVANDEEMRKQITSAFTSGAEIFAFDEAHVIEGAQMARALTSVTYADRVLGVTRIAKFPNSTTWVAMGNQVQVNGDMSRRVYYVALRPVGTTLAERDARSYRHTDLKLWTAENRPRLVAAALTVLRGWFAAGRPAHSRGGSMGSFEPWDRMMSGVTAYAGYPAFLTDQKERRSESDFEGAYWSAHVHWLREVFAANEFTTRQVQEAALRSPQQYEAPPGMEDPSGKGYTRVLGMAYSRHVDRRYEGLRLVKSGMGHRSTIKWTVIKDENGGTEVVGGRAVTPYVRKTLVADVSETRSFIGEGAVALPPVASLPPTSPSANPDTKGQTVMNQDSEKFEEPVVLGFDIETASANEMFLGRHDGLFVRLSGFKASDGSQLLDDDEQARALIGELNAADVVYGHNILKFDLVALAAHCGADYDALAAKAVDTLVLAQLEDPPGAKGMKPWSTAGYYGLDAVAQRLGHTGKSDDLKALADEFGGYDRIPVDEPRYRDYLWGDLAATQHVYDALKLNLGDGPLLDEYACREMRVAAVQNRMTLNGWKVDTRLLAERVAHEDAQREDAASLLHSEYGMPLARPDKIKVKPRAEWPEDERHRSVAVVRRYTKMHPEGAVARGLATSTPGEPYDAPWNTAGGKAAIIAAFAVAGAEHYPKTPGGDIAIGKDPMGAGDWYDAKAGVSRPGMLKAYPPEKFPGVEAIVRLVTQATGATAKYAEIATYAAPSGRVHAQMGSVQASGRWATVKPATANLDAPVREVFVAEPGHVLLTCDLSQVDVRAMAAHSQDPELIARLQPGQDYHSEMAEIFFGDRGRRKDGKPISHGLNYGQGAKAIAERNGLDLNLVARARARHKETFSVLAEWTEDLIKLAGTGALLDNGFGRLMRCDPERAYTQAPALMGQGAARDIMTESLLRLVDFGKWAGTPVTPYLRGVVHDEVILSVPEEHAEYWTGALRDAFTWEWRGVPILCSVSNPGRNWLECEH